MPTQVIWDYIVVGSGSAGCVLANRLSAGGRTVLLIEAGIDTPPESVPEDIQDTYPRSYSNPAYMWPGLEADMGPVAAKRIHFDQARVMGGGSSVMGMIAIRGVPDDYDGWARSGAPGWAWSDVLPYFRRLESDRDFAGALHGSDGPVPIRRHHCDEWPPFCRAVGEVLATQGYPMIADMNADFDDGYCRLPLSCTLTTRASAASTYLDALTRGRTNLRIECQTTVERLLFDGRRCTGVSAVTGGERRAFRANRVVVSAGAIHSPALLLRSGIGPADELARHGVPMIADAQGVGSNLQNHSAIYLAAHLKKRARQTFRMRPIFNSALRFSSGADPALRSDMLMLVVNKSSWHGLGQSIGALGVALYLPFSRGTVRLASSRPEVEPSVDFAYLSDTRDLERLVAGLGRAVALMKHPAVRALRHELFSVGYSESVRRLNRPGLMNQVIASTLAAMLDGPDWLRRAILKNVIARGERDESDMEDPEWLRTTLASRMLTFFHPAGTCRMGRETDPAAVVDARCRLLGVTGVSIADASIMPTITRANTNIPTIMIAERAADLILADD